MTVDLDALLRFAQRYSDAGWAIQEQMTDVLVNGGDAYDQNPNALAAANELVVYAESLGLLDEFAAADARRALSHSS